MGIDMFWKRVPVEAVRGRSTDELYDLVPHWVDEANPAERDAGLLVGVEDTGDLIGVLLTAGAAGGPDEAAARAFADCLPESLEDGDVGTLDPDRVRRIARMLSAAPLASWIGQHQATLAEAARSMGYHRPFDQDWADLVLEDAREVATLFQAAAAQGEAVVVRWSG